MSFTQTTLPDSCKLDIGTNLSGLCDYCTELPFVDLMKQCRAWYTSNAYWVSGGLNGFDSRFIESFPKDANGYITGEIPREVSGAETLQIVKTVWGYTNGWPAGDYTLLFEGDGEIYFWGHAEIKSKEKGRYIIKVNKPKETEEGIIELRIVKSNARNPIRNIRFLMPGSEISYEKNPFNPLWLDVITPFNTLRMMDWMRSNNHGHDGAWLCFDEDRDSIKMEWTERQFKGNYTWSGNKGVPYEMMIELCNLTKKNIWICVPYNASDDHIRQLAWLLKENLNTRLKIYVEYSNEVWNWTFGQAQWLNEFGCIRQKKTWPEGIVPYIQNTMNIFSDVFQNDMHRIVRVVGVQAAWQDVANRTVSNMRPGSFDAFSPAAYFGLSEESDLELDKLGLNATAEDIFRLVRRDRPQSVDYLLSQKANIADKYKIPMLYYEGGQHITPHPFGDLPTYEKALLNVQRHPDMKNLYQEWFDILRGLNSSNQPTLFGNFSLIAPRSSRYGSWGLLETVDQDLSQVPAPKYEAVLDNIFECKISTGVNNSDNTKMTLQILQNPADDYLQISINEKNVPLDFSIVDLSGKIQHHGKTVGTNYIKISQLLPGLYFLQVAGFNPVKFVKR
ncbi:MAG: T9SS type A sorting domain-containing protein [Bacteroidota bacterium]|nr:T9SS type A sorting domain-containing protein [Bacteroidota bacterium]